MKPGWWKAALLAAVFCMGLPAVSSAAPSAGAPAGTIAASKVTYTAADKTRYEALRTKNEGRLAPKERFLTTTAPKVVLTFGGLTRKESVEDMLDTLNRMGAKGTFFVTELELRKYPDTVREILARGHELGLGLRTGTDGDFYETCAQIERVQRNMERNFGVRPVIARQIFGKELLSVNEACSAMGVELLGQTVNTVQTKDKEAASAEDIFSHLFGKSILSMGRGQIIYTRLDFLTQPRLTGEILELIKKNKIDNVAFRSFTDSPETNPANDSAYSFASVGEVLADTKDRWTYPVPQGKILPSLTQKRSPVTDQTLDREIRKRYIGAPTVNDIDRVRGFSKTKRMQLDQTGVVKTVTDNTIFLTFDDWSTDHSINKLLYVLRKHHVPATFFIITWNVKNNPNLLRAIAEEGHNIGSHSNRHRPMVEQAATYGGNMKPMTEKEYAADVAEAYHQLLITVGDVEVNGRPALTRLFRPPTLAISKSGMKNILNAGYTYIVSGYESTDDYAAPSRQALMGALQHGVYDREGHVRKGSIIVMHMTDSAKYTAEVLDDFLTANDQRAENDPKKFKVGRLADYLDGAYDQSEESFGNWEKGLSYKGNCC